MSGLFVVLEGLDGSGTTTQAVRLGRSLSQLMVPYEVTQEPSEGPIGRQIRTFLRRELTTRGGQGPLLDPLTLALLFLADRNHHAQVCVQPMLDQDGVVVCDRYHLSTLAYQTCGPRGLSLDWLSRACEGMPFPVPDLLVFLKVRPEVAWDRLRKRTGKPPEEFERSVELLAEVGRHYEAALRRCPAKRVVVVDGEASAASVAGTVWNEVRKSLRVLGMRADDGPEGMAGCEALGEHVYGGDGACVYCGVREPGRE